MVTSIQLSEDTKKLLDSFKDAEHKTYDAVVKKLVQKNRPSVKSIFNKHPSKKPISKKEWRVQIRDF